MVTYKGKTPKGEKQFRQLGGYRIGTHGYTVVEKLRYNYNIDIPSTILPYMQGILKLAEKGKLKDEEGILQHFKNEVDDIVKSK